MQVIEGSSAMLLSISIIIFSAGVITGGFLRRLFAKAESLDQEDRIKALEAENKQLRYEKERPYEEPREMSGSMEQLKEEK